MAKFRIHFVDRTHEDVDAESGTIAKMAAKHRRIQATGATQPNDHRVKVDRVEEILPEQVAGNVIEADDITPGRQLGPITSDRMIGSGDVEGRKAALRAELDALEGRA